MARILGLPSVTFRRGELDEPYDHYIHVDDKGEMSTICVRYGSDQDVRAMCAGLRVMLSRRVRYAAQKAREDYTYGVTTEGIPYRERGDGTRNYAGYGGAFD